MNVPKTNVSFSATKAFREKWPDEAEAQQKAFELLSWQEQSCDRAHEKLVGTKPIPASADQAAMASEMTRLDMAVVLIFVTMCVSLGFAAGYFYKK